MTWTKIDDQFFAHPKVSALDIALMPAAVGLHTLALSWCANQLTDGRVPRPQVVRLIGDPTAYSLADELIRVGLWEKHGDDYQIHDYLDYNPSRGKVLAERKAAKARMQAFRGSSAEQRANSGRSSTTPVPVPKENPPLPPLVELAIDEIPISESTPEDYERTVERHTGRLSDQTIKQTIYELAAWEPKTPRKKLHLTLNTWLAKKPDDREPELSEGYKEYTTADIPDYWRQPA